MSERISASQGSPRQVFSTNLGSYECLICLETNVFCGHVRADDVAAKFPGFLLLRCSEQQLHVVLYLPNAHPFHSHGLRSPGYRKQT